MATVSDPEKDVKVNASVIAAAAELGIATGHVADESDADGVLRYAAAEAIDVDDATNKRLLRKIDLHVLPWLHGFFTCCSSWTKECSIYCVGYMFAKYKRYQFREAWLDYRTWTYVLFVLISQILAAGLTLLNSILVKNLGFDTKITLLLAMPGGLVNIAANYGFGQLADRTHKCLLACIIANLVSIFGASLFIGLGNVSPLYDRIGQLVGYYLMSGASATAWFLVISLMSSNVLGHTKKTSSNAIVFTAQGLAYFVGPLCFTDGPYYHKAKDLTLGLWLGSTVLLAVMWYLNRRENMKRDREMAEKGVSEQAAASNLAFHDLTDKQNKGFRYAT